MTSNGSIYHSMDARYYLGIHEAISDMEFWHALNQQSSPAIIPYLLRCVPLKMEIVCQKECEKAKARLTPNEWKVLCVLIARHNLPLAECLLAGNPIEALSGKKNPFDRRDYSLDELNRYKALLAELPAELQSLPHFERYDLYA